MPFRICFSIGHPPRRVCINIPVIIPDWRHFHPDPPDPDPWRVELEKVKPEVLNEIYSLNMISGLASQLHSSISQKINGVIKEHLQELQKALPQGAELSMQ